MTVCLADRWAARRALAEGEPATLDRLAAAIGVDARRFEHRAHREGWRLSGVAQGLTRAQRIERVHDRLLGRIEKAQAAAEADEDAAYDKASIAELSAAARLLVKVSEGFADHATEAAEQMVRDADIADILDKLDAKIIELARHLAKELVAAGAVADAAGASAP